MPETDRERLIEDLLRESLYSSGEYFDDVVENVAEQGGVVRVRLHGPAPDFDLVFPRDSDRRAVAAQLERKLRVARQGPDMSRPPIQG